MFFVPARYAWIARPGLDRSLTGHWPLSQSLQPCVYMVIESMRARCAAPWLSHACCVPCRSQCRRAHVVVQSKGSAIRCSAIAIACNLIFQ